jgi:transcriptional regulator with XRE-family HTH domain
MLCGVPYKDPTSAQIGDFVRRRRESLGLTIEDLAEAAGLEKSYVSGIERKRRNPSWESIRKIATGLNMKALDLVRQAGGGGLEQGANELEEPSEP